MANTFTQIYIQVVFAVQSRYNLIQKEDKEELHKYNTGIIRNKKQKLIAINSMPDHTHVFIGLKPNIALSDLVRDIKNNSSTFINEKKWVRGKFNWQEGFGAFSYSHSQIDTVKSTFKIKRNITPKKRSSRNILKCWRNSISNLIINIFLNGLRKNEILQIVDISLLRSSDCWIRLCYIHFIPTGFSLPTI